MWLRLRQIALVARELEPVQQDLQEVLGLAVCFNDPGVGHFGLENALFPIGNQFIEVVAPIQENTAGGRFLERRKGDGGYMVITQCDDHAPRRKRVEDLGVRLVYQFETPGHFKNMQMHPKDTGGSFFEIDEQLGPGAHDADGPWEPAGGADWKKAQRLDVVTGIAAAEVQAEDPEEVASRWSAIAEIPLERDSSGNPVMPLENAGVRFVEAKDGRGEGLAGLDLKVADKARLLEAAKRRGVYRGEDLVEICGMRLRLV